MRKRNLYSVVLCLSFLTLFSQHENSKWYFGSNAGLDFMSSPPTILTGAMATAEGCASVADGAGNLLFYTDGVSIWNKTHSVMANGTGLNGNSSTTQSAIIVKKPGSSNLYYVFTLDAILVNNTPLNYSIVDLSLASGNGSVTVKNNLLAIAQTEKLTYTRHCNGLDYWIVCHDKGNNNFRAFLLSSSGVNPVSVVSSVGTSPGIQVGGTVKISPYGKKIGVAVLGTFGFFEVLDFDNSTGVVSNPLNLGAFPSAYGCEFSPDGTKFYGNDINGTSITSYPFYQWDLCAGSNTAIVASKVTIIVPGQILGMQLANDGKIYLAEPGHFAISVVNNPNVMGTGCNYVHGGQSISPNSSFDGLPNFAVRFSPPPFTYTSSCQIASFTPPFTVLTYTYPINCAAPSHTLSNMVWDFGDPASGPANTSTLNNPMHGYPALGAYTAKLILYYNYNCGVVTDTIRQTVNISQLCSTVNSTSITCANLGSATVQTTGGVGPYTYTWMPTSQTNSVATGLSPGVYTLTVMDLGANFSYLTTTTLTSSNSYSGNLNVIGGVVCNGASTGSVNFLGFTGGSGSQTYLWSNGTSTYTVQGPSNLSAGTWSVTVTDGLTGCTINNTFVITQPPALTLTIVANTPSACVGASIVFTATTLGGTPPYSFSWLSGPSTNTYMAVPTLAGNAVFTLTSNDFYSCGITQTVSGNFVSNPTLIVSDTYICPLGTGILTVSGATSYLWNNSLAGSSFTDNPASTQEYTVTGIAQGCTSKATASIIIKPLPNPLITSNSPVCDTSTLTLSANSGTAYVWSGPNSFNSNAQSNSINPVGFSNAGVYQVTVTAANSCTASATKTVSVNPLPLVSISPNNPGICINSGGVILTANGTATLYNWQPNTGLSANNTQTVNANPLSTTVYTLTGSLNACSVAQTVNVAISNPPNLNITLSSQTTCAQALNGSPNTITLTSGGAITYTLVTPSGFNNPNPGGPLSPISLVPPNHSPGVSTATVYGSNGVCTVSTTAVFTIVPNPTVTVSNPTPVICAGDTYTYTSSGASSFTWSSATPGSTAYTTGNVTVSNPTTSSIFSIIGGSLGCNSAIQTTTLTVNPLPTLIVAPNPTFVCIGNSGQLIANSNASSFTWQPANGLDVINQATVMAGPKALQVYTVTATLNNCSVAAMATVSVMPLPTPTIINTKQTFCVNENIQLKGIGGVGYSWKGPGGLSFTGPEVDFKAASIAYAGVYSLSAADLNNCIGKTTTNVQLNSLPSGYLHSSYQNLCVPLTSNFVFKESPGNQAPVKSTRWELGQSVFTLTAFSYYFNQPGDYEITGNISDTNNCANILSTVVQARPKPKADFTFSPDKPVENLDEVFFVNRSAQADSYNWQFLITAEQGTGNTEQVIIESKQEHPNFMFENAGIYPVVLEARNKWNCADTVIKAIHIESDFAAYVPNSFTPNDDNRNELFKPVLRGVKFFTFSIFDRWGHKLFETKSESIAWDGTHEGKACQSDIYVWKLVVSANNGAQKEVAGNVNLYR